MVKQCRVSLRELSGLHERLPKHGTEAKPTVVSCDVSDAECAVGIKERSKYGEKAQQEESKALLVLQRSTTLS